MSKAPFSLLLNALSREFVEGLGTRMIFFWGGGLTFLVPVPWTMGFSSCGPLSADPSPWRGMLRNGAWVVCFGSCNFWVDELVRMLSTLQLQWMRDVMWNLHEERQELDFILTCVME